MANVVCSLNLDKFILRALVRVSIRMVFAGKLRIYKYGVTDKARKFVRPGNRSFLSGPALRLVRRQGLCTDPFLQL